MISKGKQLFLLFFPVLQEINKVERLSDGLTI